MTHFIRDKNNKTILDLEFWTKTDYESDGSKHTYHEISASIIINNYSKFLLEADVEVQPEIIQVFDILSEYRGWLWESYYMAKPNTGSDEDRTKIEKQITLNLNDICERFNLYHVTD